MQHAVAWVRMKLTLKSFLIMRSLHLPFNLPPAHSTTTLALLSWYVHRFCSRHNGPVAKNGLISQGSKRYAGSHIITIGTSTPLMCCSVSGTRLPDSPL